MLRSLSMVCPTARPLAFLALVAALLPGASARIFATENPPPIATEISITQSTDALPERPNHVFVNSAVTLLVGLHPGDTVQWYFNQAPIPGATFASHQILPVSLADAGNYEAEITRQGVKHRTDILVLNVATPPTARAVDTHFTFNFGETANYNPTTPRVLRTDGKIGAFVTNPTLNYRQWIVISADGSTREILDERFSTDAQIFRGLFADGSHLLDEFGVTTLVAADGTLTTIPDASARLASAHHVQKHPDGPLVLADSINLTGLSVSGEVLHTHSVGAYGVITISGLQVIKDGSHQLLLIGDSIDESGHDAKLAMPLGLDGLPPANFRPIIHHQAPPLRLQDGSWVLIDAGRIHNFDADGRLLRQRSLPDTPGEWIGHPDGSFYVFVNHLGILRYDANLIRDASFFVAAPPHAVFNASATLFRPDGSLIISGRFNSLEGHPSSGLAQIKSGPLLPDASPLVVIEHDDTPRRDESFALRAAVLGSGPFTYEWLSLDGAPLPAPHDGPNLSFAPFGLAHAGRFQLKVTGPFGVSLSEVVDLRISSVPFLSNLSGQGRVSASVSPLIAGFVVANEPHARAADDLAVLLRGIGPTLANFGVENYCADPVLEWRDLATGDTEINDNWVPLSPTGHLVSLAAGAFPLNSDSTDAHIFTEVQAGAYLATVSAKADSPGIALAEIYAPSGSNSGNALANLSLRGHLGRGDDVLIGGFIIRDPAEFARPLRVLIRAVGPGLTDFGVEGVCADPVLTLFDQSGAVIATNDNWADATVSLADTFQQLGAFPLVADSLDAAILIELPPGAYTAHVGGQAGAEGQALLEIYRLPYVSPTATTP